MIPSVSIRKVDGGTGVVRPTDVGIGAIISTSETGPANEAVQFLQVDAALAEFGGGDLVELGAYTMPVSGNPVLLVKGTGSTPASYGDVTPGVDNTGATVASAGGTDPLGDFDVLITCTKAGTVGTPGIEYTFSLDGGRTTRAPRALDTDTSILIADAGITLDFTVATMAVGDTYECPTTGPKNGNGDLADGLEALRKSRSPFEIVLFDGPADATTVGDVDTWLADLETTGRFKTAILTARPRATDGSETEDQYKTFLDGVFSAVSASSSKSVCVFADVGECSSPIADRDTSGAIQARPAGLAAFARALAIPIGEDPAYVGRGPVAQFAITDDRGNPKFHDEYIHPGLDDLRLGTLRSFDGRQGTYITNAPLLTQSGSDFVYLQHARTINRACEIAYQILGNALSRGVRKSTKVGPLGERYIAEGAALQIEAVVNSAILAELTGQVDGIRFALSRTDDISSNAGAVVTGGIQDVSLAYIKQFKVTAGFVKALT